MNWAPISAAGLRSSLLEVAKTTAARFEPGMAFDVKDLGAAGFLSASGMQALEHADLDQAAVLMRATVNIYNAVDARLAGDRGTGSVRERHMNLSSAWNNYAQTQQLLGKRDAALAAFVRSLEHAYLGGIVGSLLVALTNVLHYALQLNDVRRCLRLADAAIRIADRLGAVQSSIELRLLAAMYRADRHELWAAQTLVDEARRRAKAIGDRRYERFADVQGGGLLLQRGRLLEGLAALADATAGSANAAFLFRPVVEVRQHLVALGVPQERPFGITLRPEDVADLAARLRREADEAAAAGRLPWDGKPFAVSPSSALKDDHLRALFHLGVAEFDGRSAEAIDLGRRLAAWMLDQGHFQEARWAAENVAANPSATAEDRGAAHAVLAHAAAALGFPEDVDDEIDAALAPFAEAGVAVSFAAADVALWHAIQSGRPKAGAECAGRFVEALRGRADADAVARETIARIDTWGAPMLVVAQAFRAARAASGDPPAAAAAAAAAPFRRFTGATADLTDAGVDGAREAFRDAQAALAAGDRGRAAEILHWLVKDKAVTLSDHQAGIAVALQVRAADDRATPAQLDAAMDAQRKGFVGQLAFSALARLETALAWTALERREPALAARLVSTRSFVADLSADPIRARGPRRLGSRRAPARRRD